MSTMRRIIFASLVLAPLCAFPFLFAEEAPKPATGPRLESFPAKITLETSRARQSIVSRIAQPNGITKDVTTEAQLSVADPKIAVFEGNILKPLADGTTEVRVTHSGQTQAIPLTVHNATVERPISFKLDVMPVFLSTGCNVGSCHGAARGKDGFRLSLFGFDPDGDYFRITRELATRRINLAQPKESLLLLKSIGAVPHTGGKRFAEDGPQYATIMRWLEAGAPKDSPEVAKPTSLEILPTQMVLEGEGAKQQMVAVAHYSDGTERDVTSQALFLTNNENSAAVSPAGLVTAAKRGEAFVMARFATFTVGSQAIVIPKDLKYEFPNVPENNYIDGLVNNKLKKLRIVPSELCSDEVFLRRAYIDIVGQLPTASEHDRFVTDTDAKKRDKLVDELLNRKEFVEMWVMKWAELLEIRSNNDVSYKSALLYYQWLEDRISRNVPFNQIVRELISATGGTFKSPATNYYQITKENLKLSENTAQVFMGVRVQCAQCHNHPFDRWTQDDYYGFAAFFSQIARKAGDDPREVIVFNGGGGEMKHPLGDRVVAPKFLGGETPDTKGKDRREVLADWISSPENPYFAKNLGNIVWSHFFGRGIVEPVDDVRISNPSSNPELIEELGKKFQSYNYDFKRLVRDICTSRSYQLDTHTNPTNEADERNFSHATVRRMRAEVLLDCIGEVTNTKEKFRGLPLGSRAVQIADGTTSNYFLTTFGRATRETVCSCEVSMQPSLSQALHLLNGDTVQSKITNGNLVKQMLDAKQPPEQIVKDLYTRCYSRQPNEKELAKLLTFLPQAHGTTQPSVDETQKALNDLFWAMLNSQEFLFNH